jgi:hypothetical protein
MHHCNCSMQEVGIGQFTASSHSDAAPGATDKRRSFSNNGGGTSSEIVPTTSQPGLGQADAGNRRKVAKALRTIGKYLGTPGHDLIDDSWCEKALDYPVIPGEEGRNPDLPQLKVQYKQSRDANGNVTPRERPSRAGSITNSVVSGLDIEGSSTTPRAALPPPPSSRSPSPSPSPTTPRIPHASTLPAERTPFERQNPPSPSSAGTLGGGPRLRRDTLEVPSAVHHRPM